MQRATRFRCLAVVRRLRVKISSGRAGTTGEKGRVTIDLRRIVTI